MCSEYDHRPNQSRIGQCEREIITAEKAEAFAELGDGSPLYRCVQHSLGVCPSRPTDAFPQIYALDDRSLRRDQWLFLLSSETGREGVAGEGEIENT